MVTWHCVYDLEEEAVAVFMSTLWSEWVARDIS